MQDRCEKLNRRSWNEDLWAQAQHTRENTEQLQNRSGWARET